MDGVQPPDDMPDLVDVSDLYDDAWDDMPDLDVVSESDGDAETGWVQAGERTEVSPYLAYCRVCFWPKY